MNDQERLWKLLDFLGVSANALSKKIGWKQPQTFYDIRRGKIHISKRLADSIVAVYPRIDKRWLLMGDGSMLKSQLPQETLHHFELHEEVSEYETARKSEMVSMPREVFDQIRKLTETVFSQQRTIELLEAERSASSPKSGG